MVIAAALFAGFLLGAAFAPLSLWFCAPLALAILLYLLHHLSKRSFAMKLLVILCFGTTFYLPLLSWSNTYVGNVPWLILATLQILFLLPIAFISFSIDAPWRVATFPSAWVALEWCAAHFPFGGFGWGRVGFSQANAPYAALARFGGVPLISFFVASIASVIYFLVMGEKGSKLFKIIGRYAGGVLTLAVFLVLLSPTPQRKADFSVVGIQGGVPQMGLNFNDRAAAVFNKHLSTTSAYMSSHKNRVDLIIWPENSVDIDPFANTDISAQITALTNKLNLPILIGAVTNIGARLYNESILWVPGRGATSRYVKQHLTPFGEYIPLRAMAERISPYARTVADFYPGIEKVLHKTGKAVVAPIICYELLDDALGRSMTEGSNLITVQTNNATFGLGSESMQQLNITRIRAIEHQKFVVSISTTGVSAFIDPRGKITQLTSQNSSAVIQDKIALLTGRSFSDRYGSQVELALILMGLPILVISRRQKRSK